MTGEELLSACAEGDAFLVWRRGGLHGAHLAEDIASGSWRTQPYETAPGDTPPNGNWFLLQDFEKAIDAG